MQRNLCGTRSGLASKIKAGIISTITHLTNLKSPRQYNFIVPSECKTVTAQDEQLSTSQVISARDEINKREDLGEQHIQLMFEGENWVLGNFNGIVLQHYPHADRLFESPFKMNT